MRCFSGRGVARGYERGRAHIRALNRAHALNAAGVITLAGEVLPVAAPATDAAIQPTNPYPTQADTAAPSPAHPRN